MNLKKMLFVWWVTVLAMVISVSQVMAGGGPEPVPGTAKIGPTEIWGVTVVSCPLGQSIGIIRVKRVVDCDIVTEVLVEPNWAFGCPADESAVVGQSLQAGTTFFGIPGTAFFSKVKNFDKAGNVVIFDAQFKFWTPVPQ
jgi:hypothetical protein